MSWFARRVSVNLILALGLIAVSTVAVASPDVREFENVVACDRASAQAGEHCAVDPIWRIRSQDRLVWLNTSIRIDRAAREPLGVFVKAFAASAVYWDGRLIGRNGIPANSAAREVPGLRDAVIPVPTDLSRAGEHQLQIEMSTMRSPLRLASPVLELRIAPFEEPLQPALRSYIPALLTAGGMLLAILCLGLWGWKQNRIRSFGYLLGAGFLATAQLAAESSRAFVQLLYPDQVLRLELVLLCACGFGLLLTTYVSQRFEVPNRRMIIAVQALLTLSLVILLPGLDEKIAGAILSSAALSMAISVTAISRKKTGAPSLSVMLGLCLFFGVRAPATFLDRDFYIWVFLLFALLLAQECQAIGEARHAGAGSAPEPQLLSLGSGPTRHLVSATRIVRLAAADDYTEVFIAGAPSVLHPEPLHTLLDRLPSGFVRVHRSHAVNLAYLESYRKGPKGTVTLADQSVTPVSRRRMPKLVAVIAAH